MACMDGRSKYFTCVFTDLFHTEWMIALRVLEHTSASIPPDGISPPTSVRGSKILHTEMDDLINFIFNKEGLQEL